MTRGSFSVLLVEEDADERLRIRRKLVTEFIGAAVIEVASADDLERSLEGDESDVAVVDLGVSWSTGREVFRGMRARWPDVPVIMLTPDGDEEGTADAIEAGLDDLIPRSRIGVWLGPSIRAAIARGEHLRVARAAEQATRDAVSVLESTLEATADGILVVDLEGRIVTFNRRFAQMWRIPLELLESRDDDRAIAHVLGQLADPDVFLRKVRELYGQHEAESFDLLEFQDGRVFERNSLPQRLEGRAIGRVWSFRDVTERRRAEAQLRQSEEELRGSLDRLRATDRERRELLHALVNAQEEERKRISADIHDDSIQAITAVGLRLSTLRARTTDPDQRSQFDRLAGTVEDSIGRLRRLMFELRPRALDEEGLASALRMSLDQLADQAGVICRLEDHLVAEPSPAARTVLYRIAQEALTNARKHAKASAITVVLEPREHGFLVRVRDDGVGMDLSSEDEHGPGHVGMSAMRERVEMARGWLRIGSSPGGGTTVEAWLPADA